jgi:DNA topoisomerase II
VVQSRVVGGRHGYGAKLTNIFSNFFEVETFDSKRKKLYTQNWSNNMSSVSTPVIRTVQASEKLSDYTQITFEPQMSRFAATSGAATSVSQSDLIRNATRLFEKRAYDMAATLPGVSVTFNGAVIPIPNFATYVKMYSPKSFDKSSSSSSSSSSVLQISPEEDILDSFDLSSGLIETSGVDLSSDNDGIVYAKVNPRWEVAVTKSSGSFDSVSFVNNLATVKGGTHVSLVTEQVILFPIRISDDIYVMLTVNSSTIL